MKKILIFIMLFFCINLMGCDLLNQQPTDNPSYESPELVDDSNLASEPINESENKDENDDTLLFEEKLVNAIAFATKATICVKNYQTTKSQVATGGSWWNPTYETVIEEILYGTGSGVIYYKAKTTDNQYLYKVITNEHVIASPTSTSVVSGKERFTIYDEKYSEEINANLIGYDADNDIAVLEFTSEREYSAVKFANVDDIHAGRFVIAVGTPIDTEFYNTATYGIISRVKAEYIQHDAAINSGNSGGPLFNLKGNLVGINNAKLSGSTSSGVSIEGIYFAIPISTVSKVIKKITGLDEICYA